MSGDQRNNRQLIRGIDPKPIRAQDYESAFRDSLPDTLALLISGRLTLHPGVSSVVLHGSRGPYGAPRPDSDIDLSLLVDQPEGRELEPSLLEVLNTTLNHWHGAVALDLAVIFDMRNCGLACFQQSAWNEQICQQDGLDCFGLYKTQKGFRGLVSNAGIEVRRMYPCLRIWQRRSRTILT